MTRPGTGRGSLPLVASTMNSYAVVPQHNSCGLVDSAAVRCGGDLVNPEMSSTVFHVSPKGRNGRQAAGEELAPSRPVPGAEPPQQDPRRNAPRILSRAQRLLTWRTRRDPSAIDIRKATGRGFDAQAWTRVSWNGCPKARLTEPSDGARPNLENSTACQKSMPITSSRGRRNPVIDR